MQKAILKHAIKIIFPALSSYDVVQGELVSDATKTH